MNDGGNLTRWRLFADMSAADAEVIVSACEDRVLAAGEELFHEGDPGDSLYIVQSGRVDVSKQIRRGVDRVLAALGPGDVIGEMSFIDGSRRSAGARTGEPTEFHELGRAAFGRITRERPDIAAAFYRNLGIIAAGRLRTTTELYRESVAFGLEATGAGALNLKSLMEELRPVVIHLGGGVALAGRILQVDHHQAGYTVVLKDAADKVSIVPYHAISRIELT